MDAYVEAIDGYIVIKFKKFLVEEGENDIIFYGLWYPVSPGMGFLALLAIRDDSLGDLLPNGPTMFKIHEYCNSISCFFTITSFTLSVHVLDKTGLKQFSFKHASMVLSILILVLLQVLEVFNRPYLSPPPPLILSLNIKVWKEEQPIRSLYYCQEIPRFALHGI